MKKNLKTLIAIVLAMFPLLLLAQSERSGFNLNKRYAPGALASKETVEEAAPEFRNDIPMKALRSFFNHYKKARNINWYIIDDGFIAQFDTSGVQTRVQYDIKGGWQETICNYTEESMPNDLRNMVKDFYSGFHVIVAHKIETNKALMYVVKIENETQFKVLEIRNGEMKLTGDYVKG